jgi:phosphatidate cytidylyltransferase
MKTLLTRSVTGLIFGVIVIGCMWYSVWTLGALFLVATTIGLIEYNRLVNKLPEVNSPRIWTLFTGLLLYILFFLFAIGELELKWLLLFVPLFVLGASFNLFSKQRSIANVAVSLTGVVYIAFPFAMLAFLGMLNGEYSFHIPLGLLILIWSHDSGAYFVGSAIGKHPLMKKVSPKKSWEGFGGGVVFSFVAAYMVSLFYTSVELQDWMVLAALVVVFGNLGDLTESALKRRAGVKDSGNLMPGHGGVLDRFDSLIFIAPVVLVYLMLFKA